MVRKRTVVVTGTGTGLGKTHVAEALLRALGARGVRTSGLKAVETGVNAGVLSDAARLAEASTFHVQHPGYAFEAGVSPHLAAREAGAAPIRIETVLAFVEAARPHADVILVELPGGLFTPLTDDLVNADLAAALRPDLTLLIAPDRLGALHDVLAAARAAAVVPLRLDAAILVAPESPDASTGRNGAELRRLTRLPCVAEVPRSAPQSLAATPAIQTLVALILAERPRQ